MQELPPGYIHLSIRLSLLGSFHVLKQLCLTPSDEKKLEAADGKPHPRGTKPPPSRFQGWEWERAMAEQTKWCMSHQHGSEGEMHEKFESAQIYMLNSAV